MALKVDTKKLLADSLEELLATKPLQAIRVKDITENCGASHATFYRHFKDKYDLMNWVYQTNVDAILAEHRDITTWREWLVQVLKFIKKKKTYFGRVVAYQDQNSFLGFLTDYSLRYFLNKTENYLAPDKVPAQIQFAIKIFCYGCCQLVVEWIEGGCKESAEKLADYISGSVPAPIVEVLG